MSRFFGQVGDIIQTNFEIDSVIDTTRTIFLFLVESRYRIPLSFSGIYLIEVGTNREINITLSRNKNVLTATLVTSLLPNLEYRFTVSTSEFVNSVSNNRYSIKERYYTFKTDNKTPLSTIPASRILSVLDTVSSSTLATIPTISSSSSHQFIPTSSSSIGTTGANRNNVTNNTHDMNEISSSTSTIRSSSKRTRESITVLPLVPSSETSILSSSSQGSSNIPPPTPNRRSSSSLRQHSNKTHDNDNDSNLVRFLILRNPNPAKKEEVAANKRIPYLINLIRPFTLEIFLEKICLHPMSSLGTDEYEKVTMAILLMKFQDAFIPLDLLRSFDCLSLNNNDVILVDIDYGAITFELEKTLTIDEILAEKISEAEQSGALVDVETLYTPEMDERIKTFIKKQRLD